MESRSEWQESASGKAELGIVVHEGREFAALGSAITPDYLACYPDDKGNVNAWDGTRLGYYRVISSRPAVFFGQRSWQGDRYYFMRATVNGVQYSLRGFGVGMLARGKATKSAERGQS